MYSSKYGDIAEYKVNICYPISPFNSWIELKFNKDELNIIRMS